MVVLDEEHGDERRVSFAPGTPEPKPTSRKKKSTKGTKGKKKKASVIEGEKARVERHVEPVLGERPFTAIGRPDVKALLRR